MSIEISSKEMSLSLDKNSSEVKKIIDDMLQFTQSLIVDSESAFRTVTNLYRQSKDWRKIIEEKRKQATDPFRKQVSTINDKAKELSDPLCRVEELTKMKADGYQKMLEDAKKLQDQAIREAAIMLDIHEDLYIPPLEKSIRGDGAIAYTKVEKKFKLVDIDKVPAKYLKIDEAAIKQDIKLGVNTIPGIEIYEEKSTQLRSR